MRCIELIFLLAYLESWKSCYPVSNLTRKSSSSLALDFSGDSPYRSEIGKGRRRYAGPGVFGDGLRDVWEAPRPVVKQEAGKPKFNIRYTILSPNNFCIHT